ncbi:hypothetical protein [Rhodopirellula sp. P2]|uniref:hypothetical protein n=1 Tax=Rhodopirellula sp. P2 TaxID=2127060 RepID=UPI002368DAB1|nr:hypothetical protein [Rhodopirellula sp. P2]WDQ14851.1 hypothetical protein PSR62_14505 [Rhodopirellula sp. P2]
MSNLKADPTKQRAIELKHYFSNLEQAIVRKLHDEAGSDFGRQELIRSTGIHDPQLIEELGKLGVTADGLMALRLFPLVLVAWAEKNVDQKEREAVIEEAQRIGIQEDSTAGILLDEWLQVRPPGLCVDAWKRYMHERFRGMSSVAQQRLILLTEKQMTSVAKASGGHLGFGKVSAKEKAIIHQVITAMRQQTQTN